MQLHWSAAIEGFAEVADEAIKRAAIDQTGRRVPKEPSWR